MIYDFFLKTDHTFYDGLSVIASNLDIIGADLGNDHISFKHDENGIICIKIEKPTVLVSQMPEYENIIKARRLTNPKPSSPTKSSRFKRAGGKDIIITERQKQDIKNNKNY